MPAGATPRPSRGPLLLVVLILVAGALTAAWGIASRSHAMGALAKETRELAVPSVAVIKPQRGGAAEEITLPGNVQAYTDAAIFARTTGYLKSRSVDIGSRVKTGQMLAQIDTPELDQQLLQARADLASAEANANLARTTADRYQQLIKRELVSHQDLDNAVAGYEAKKAAVLSASANVNRLQQLQAFKTVVAPFAGVITARNTDIGALIGGAGSPRELFHIAAIDRLRISVNVPQTYSRIARPGLDAEIEIQELPGRRFPGRLTRTAQSIDPASRSLLAEIDLSNRGGEILPGSFAQVHFKLPAGTTALRLPVNTLIFRSEGLRVAVVRDGKVALVPVTLGRDFGSTVEVVAGLAGNESVVLNPPDSLSDGEAVEVAPTPGKGSQP